MFLTCFVTCFGVSPAPHAAWGLHVGKEGLVVQRLSRYAAPGDSEQSVRNGGHLHPGDSEQSVRNGGCLHHGTASRACGRVAISTPGTASRASGRVGLSTTRQRAEHAEGWSSPPWDSEQSVRNGGSLHHGDSEQSRVEGWVSPRRLCCASLCQVCARLLPRGQHCT